MIICIFPKGTLKGLMSVLNRKYIYKRKRRLRMNRVIGLCAIFVCIVGFSIFVYVRGHSPGDGKDKVSMADDVLDNASQADAPRKETAAVTPTLQNSTEQASEPDDAAVEPEDQTEFDPGNPWYEPKLPLLVNGANPIPEGYTVDLKESRGGYSLDAKTADALEEMMIAAERDGVSLWIVSAYRSTEKQTINFDNKVSEYMGNGYSQEEAVMATSKYIAFPGTSEHSTGMAVDINSLEESFENTQAFTWLYTHCAEYGFILRYPKDKQDVTKYNYEPWHYRYVGSNHAQSIMSRGLCLEEYMEEML